MVRGKNSSSCATVLFTDLMSSIFILGLSDQYTKEKLFQIPAKASKSTVEFDELVRAASDIQ